MIFCHITDKKVKKSLIEKYELKKTYIDDILIYTSKNYIMYINDVLDKSTLIQIKNLYKLSLSDVFFACYYKNDLKEKGIYAVNKIIFSDTKNQIYPNLYYDFDLKHASLEINKDIFSHLIDIFLYKRVFFFVINNYDDYSSLYSILEKINSISRDDKVKIVDNVTIDNIAKNLKLSHTLKSELKKIIYMSKNIEKVVNELVDKKVNSKKEGAKILGQIKEKYTKEWI